MELLIDDANVTAIERIYEYYPVDGVTTNPSILANSGCPPFVFIKCSGQPLMNTVVRMPGPSLTLNF